MSLIFDALQKSGIEQSGIEYPDMMSVATQVFEAQREHVFAEGMTAESEPGGSVSVMDAPPTEIPASHKEWNPSPKFPSLEVSLTSSSRLVHLTEPDCLAAEKFRFLGVRLRQLRQNRGLKRVLVTSTIPQEGKSLVSANLAGVLARRKERVLLLEGDLRRPVFAKQFGLGRLAGLGQYLQGGTQEVSNIFHLKSAGFWLMPAGDPPANPLELMQSGRLTQLMTELSNLFDWIIIDSPPLLPLADTTVWARLADGVLLVTREGITEKGPLKRGLEVLKTSELLGVVLNSCSNLDQKSYYSRYSPEGSK